MNRIKSTLATWMQSLPLRGEEGWVAPRSIMALMAVLGLAGLGVAQSATPPPRAITPSRSTTIALTSDEQGDSSSSTARRTASQSSESKTRRATMSAKSSPR